MYHARMRARRRLAHFLRLGEALFKASNQPGVHMRDLMPISLGRACRFLWMYAVSMLLCILGLAGAWAQEPTRSQPQVPDSSEPNAKPVHDQKSSQDVTDKLKKAFESKNAAYAESNIQPVVDDQSVTLNGTVKS